jgi:hypothetical protein
VPRRGARGLLSVRKGLLVVIFDTLRTDFLCLAEEIGIDLPGFRSLFSFVPNDWPMWCGSFPTVPMRTDLLTGRLCFLDRQWDRPQPGEPTWVADSAIILPVPSLHLGDNYMVCEESLGGYFSTCFGDVMRLRGVGADPWAELPERDDPPLPDRSLLRSELLERQYRANLVRDPTLTGPSAAIRLCRSAAAHLAPVLEAGGLAWLECFQCHEPWCNPRLDGPEVPAFPRYGRVGAELPRGEASRQRRLYIQRLSEVDGALQLFLLPMLRRIDCNILILSDHGIYLGEYGLFGKPKGEPILPELGTIICRTNFDSPTGRCLPAQPHELAKGLFAGLTSSKPLSSDSELTYRQDMRPVGRNSPGSRYLQVLTAKGSCLFPRTGGSPLYLQWSELQPSLPWEDQLQDAPEILRQAQVFLQTYFGQRAWVREFFHGTNVEVTT